MEQLSLNLRPDREGANVLPFAVRWRKVRRAAKRQVAESGIPPAQLPEAARIALDRAVLNEVRAGARKRAMEAGTGRMSKHAWFVYVCKPEGRRVTRVIERLSEKIASQEARLCG